MSIHSDFPWLNIVQYPFVTREFDTGDGWMSYVDHGQGRPIVFVHGSPTWSYSFRHLIRGLCPWYRCIAPDHLGFGLSEKRPDLDYRPEKQADRFEKLMLHLNLRDVTLVVHDQGAPIGLNFSINYPGRVRELVVFNSWLWPQQDNRTAMRLATLVGHPINRLYYRMLNATPGFIMPALFADRHRIPKTTQMQYLEPFRGFDEREGLYQMIQALRKSGTWYQTLWDRRDAIQHKRTLFMWGLKDPMFTMDHLAKWESEFKYSETVQFPNVGRYVPEEAAKTALSEIRWFLLRSPTLMNPEFV